MDAHALTIKTVRDGPVCTLVLCGDLDLLETGRFLEQAALAVDDLTELLGFDLAGVLFLDCAGVRALRIATRFAPDGCTGPRPRADQRSGYPGCGDDGVRRGPAGPKTAGRAAGSASAFVWTSQPHCAVQSPLP